tara:strand:- start:386 stop:583 length:198 start_codon:yes stop_codon:yes gene_type:complete
MVVLTKLDDRKILVNLESIKYLEEIPDTLILFMNGESVIVKESIGDIQESVCSWQSRVFGSSSDS